MSAHTCAKHEPGTPACYRDCRCRCRQCGGAQYRYEVLRQLDPSPRRIPPHGVRRRVQALVRLGWAEARLSVLCGWEVSTLHAVLRRRYVSRRTYRVITALYDRLWDTPPMPSTPAERMVATRNRRRAEANGWALPMQWDDGTGPYGIDNPDAQPYPARPVERCNVAWAEVLELIELGTPLTDLTRRLGLTAGAIERACHRHGRGDLWAGLRPARLDGREQEGRAA